MAPIGPLAIVIHGGRLSKHRYDRPHHEQLKTLLEASRELNDLLADLRIARRFEQVSESHPSTRCGRAPRSDPDLGASAGEETLVIEGDRLLSAQDCRELARRLSKSPDWDPSGYLILNDLRSCGLGARFRGIINLMAFSVDEKDAGGLLIALNKSDATVAANRTPGSDGRTTRVAMPAARPERPIAERLEAVPFRRIDAAVLMPFGSLLGTPVEQLAPSIPCPGTLRGADSLPDRRHRCQRFVHVRTQRTRAAVAVELGRELGLSELELGDIYLGGLLHDIGKIGVPDSVLCKLGP